MKLSHNQPYKILWWTMPFCLGLILLRPEAALDIQLHDTYYVIAAFHIAIFSCLLLGLLGGIYWLLRNYRMIRILSLGHSIITSILILGIGMVAIGQTIFREAYTELFKQTNSVVLILIGILVLVQFVFIINLVLGLFRE